MKKVFFIFLIISQYTFSQVDSIKTDREIVAEIENLHKDYQDLKLDPKKAGWRSAVLPGWGQYYNRKYWKIPIVWGAIGTGVVFIVWNQKQYRRYRNAFEAELNGQTHEFSDITGVDLRTALGNTQDARKRQRDYAIAITAGLYLLNILDAVVDAHLYEGRKDPDLAISPVIINDWGDSSYAKLGLAFSYKF